MNSVNNFIGILLDWKILEKIVEIVCIVDVYVLIDEVYVFLMDKGEFLLIVDVYEKGIVINFLFKIYFILGICIGWIVIGFELVEVFWKYWDYMMICGGVLLDDFVVYVLKNKEKILEWN